MDPHKYIVLLCDDQTNPAEGVWSVATQTADKELAVTEYEELKADGTPSVMIYTGDFITF